MARTMELGNFAPIAAYCAERDIAIHEVVLDAPHSLNTIEEHCHTFSAVHAAFAGAAWLLRNKPGLQLINRSLVPDDIASTDSASYQLITLLNSTRIIANGDSWDTSFTSSKVGSGDSCMAAEEAFSQTFAGMKGLAKRLLAGHSAGDSKGFELFVGERQRPIFLRKSIGEPTVLTLHDITINGVRYPAGTIARLNTEKDDRQKLRRLRDGHGTYRPIVSESAFRLFSVAEIKRLGALRLSAFATPPAERAGLLKIPQQEGYFEYMKSDHKNVLQKMPIETMQKRALEVAKALAIRGEF